MGLNIEIAFVHKNQNEIQYVSERNQFEYSERAVYMKFVCILMTF